MRLALCVSQCVQTRLAFRKKFFLSSQFYECKRVISVEIPEESGKRICFISNRDLVDLDGYTQVYTLITKYQYDTWNSSKSIWFKWPQRKFVIDIFQLIEIILHD